MKLDFTSLKKAIKSFEDSINFYNSETYKSLTEEQKETVKAGVIQNFEFTYELCWKFMRRYLKEDFGPEVDGISRKELFRLSKQKLLIDDLDKWIAYHTARNETSHAYDSKKAEEVLKIAIEFLSEARKLLFELEKRNE